MKIVVQTDIRLACSNMLLWWESAETERTVQKSPRTQNWSQDYVGLVTKFLQSMIRHTLSSVSQSISQTDITHPVCILGFVETRIKHVSLEWPNSSNTISTEVT